jgi:hypothetical protein
MRGCLIFLAIAFPVVLASPTFWSIVNMNFGAERVGYVRQNGSTQWAWIGPKSPWPNWALVPANAKLTVGAHFEAAPGEIASGFADVFLEDTSRAATDVYVGALERLGWTVQSARFDTVAPELPPRPLHLCLVEARKGVRSLRLTLERAAEGGNASLHWAEGPVPVMKGSVPGPC